jgi:hypothetical protein
MLVRFWHARYRNEPAGVDELSLLSRQIASGRLDATGVAR